MATTKHFENFYARLADDPLDATQASVLSMQVTKRVTITDGAESASRTDVSAVDRAGLASLMSDADLLDFKAAFDAEVTSRGI